MWQKHSFFWATRVAVSPLFNTLVILIKLFPKLFSTLFLIHSFCVDYKTHTAPLHVLSVFHKSFTDCQSWEYIIQIHCECLRHLKTCLRFGTIYSFGFPFEEEKGETNNVWVPYQYYLKPSALLEYLIHSWTMFGLESLCASLRQNVAYYLLSLPFLIILALLHAYPWLTPKDHEHYLKKPIFSLFFSLFSFRFLVSVYLYSTPFSTFLFFRNKETLLVKKVKQLLTSKNRSIFFTKNVFHDLVVLITLYLLQIKLY